MTVLQSPPDVDAKYGPAAVIPQRERVTYLVHLSRMFGRARQIATAFAVIDGYMVLNVIPMGCQGRARTIGCRYADGAWWFYCVRTGWSIRPANDVQGAAHQISAQLGRAA